MTRQEFKASVHKHERSERLWGYILFLIPLGSALWSLVVETIELIKNPQSSDLTFALVFVLLTAGFAWWGFGRIKRAFKTFMLFKFDPTKLTARELVNVVMEKLKYRVRKNDSGMAALRSQGWQTDHVVYTAAAQGELFVDLRLEDNYGFFKWTTKRLKKRLVDEVTAIGKERACEILVEMDAQ